MAMVVVFENTRDLLRGIHGGVIEIADAGVRQDSNWSLVVCVSVQKRGLHVRPRGARRQPSSACGKTSQFPWTAKARDVALTSTI